MTFLARGETFYEGLIESDSTTFDSKLEVIREKWVLRRVDGFMTGL